MRKARWYRPEAVEPLEDRVVLSQAGQPTLFGTGFSIPAQVQTLLPVREAFATFLADYARAVEQVLLAPGPDGSIQPGVNRPAFNAEVAAALNRLDESVISAVEGANLPNSAGLVEQIQEAILGDEPGSLASRLNALPTPPSQPGTTSTLLIAASHDVAEVARGVVIDLRASLRPTQVPTGLENAFPTLTSEESISLSRETAEIAASQKVRQAYNTFLQNYFRAVKDVLFAPGADGTVQPAANRAAFDAKVQGALKTLDDGVVSAIGNLPAASTLSDKARSVLTGEGGDSLRSKLAALPTPGAAEGSAVRVFGFNSTQAIGHSLALLMGDVAAFVRGTGSKD